MSLKSKIQSLLAAANETTGESDTNLTDAMQNLIDGYGGGTTKYTVSYNLATNIVSSNVATKVNESASYQTTISSTDVNYQVDEITVTMGGIDISSAAVSGNVISIASVTGNVAITVTALYYPSVELSASVVNVVGGQTGTFGVRLSGEPTQSQAVAIIADDVTVSSNLLTFTDADWETYQYVTITTPSVDADTYANVIVRNSDPLMTDSGITVVISAPTYADVEPMIIPDGQVTCTLADFTTSTYQGGTVLDSYIGNATNIKVPLSLDANENLYFNQNCFKGNTSIQYLELPPEIKRINSAHFEGMTALIGLKWHKSGLTNLSSFFKGCTSYKWWDGLLLNTGATNMTNYLSTGTVTDVYALEYLPDLSVFTSLTSLKNAFVGCTSLKKIFGLPTAYTNACDMTAAFYNCSQLEKLVVGSNVTNATSLLRMASSTNTTTKVYIYEDNLTTSNSGDMLTRNVGPVVYAHNNTSTWTRLAGSSWVTNGTITLHDMSGGGDLPVIVTWGDSLTSEGTSWTCWPDRLRTKLGANNFIVRNEAVSGEFTTSTSARQGGNTLKLKESITIPASGAVTINGSQLGTKDGHTFVLSGDGGSFSPLESFNPCSISGISGVMANPSPNVYTFTRLTSGSETVVPADTYIYSNQDSDLNNEDVIMLINLGNNSGWGVVGDSSKTPVATSLISQVQYMIDHFEDEGGTKYIVCGPSTGKFVDSSDQYYTAEGKAATLEYESLAASAFGSHWLNLRTYGIEYGLTQNNLTATAEDTERMERGAWPLQLIQGNGDYSHPNAYGANTQMLAFYEKGVALGYWE